MKIILDKAKDHNQLCPVRDIIHRISDKWSLLSILVLGAHGTMRFNALKKEIGDVSQRMLTVTLRNLEEDGFVSRKIYAEAPPRVEYQLTEMGQNLMQQVLQLAEWANAQLPEIISSRKKFNPDYSPRYFFVSKAKRKKRRKRTFSTLSKLFSLQRSSRENIAVMFNTQIWV